MSLEKITALSVKYGSDARFVLAGGGNTSFKDETYLYVKPSGVSLAAIQPENFVKMERAQIRKIFTEKLSADVNEREAAADRFCRGFFHAFFARLSLNTGFCLIYYVHKNVLRLTNGGKRDIITVLVET